MTVVQTPAGEPDGPAPVRTRARGQIIPPPIKVRQTVVIDGGQIIPPPFKQGTVRRTVVIDRGQIIPPPIKVRQTVVIDRGQIIPPPIKV